MPLYDYRCEKCAHVTEVRHGFGDVHDAPCAACGGALRRVFNPAPILFKGSGFYVTDSRPSGGGEAASTASTPSAESAPTPAATPAAAPATTSSSAEPAA